MSTTSVQEALFKRIREMIPATDTVVDTIGELLHLSHDSAYRRIRGETPLVLEEASLLCRHFNISLDSLMDISADAVVFRNIRIDNEAYSYEKYISGLLGLASHIAAKSRKEIVYLTKDVPIFHNFYFQPLIAFRYFFWMKSILQHPDFSNQEFSFDGVTAEITELSRQLARAYTQTPSIEIWNTECINSTISQIEFYKESGLFSSVGDVKAVYEALEETVLHLRTQVEAGEKFMPGEKPTGQGAPFRFFYNRVILGDNTILVTADETKTVYINYDVLNYMATSDTVFCLQCSRDLQNLMRKATLISETGERQRNIFFHILLSKIRDRKNNL